MLDDLNFIGTPLSLCSAAYIVKGDLHQNSTTLLINIIRSLTATIHSWEEMHKAAITALDNTTNHLNKKV
jgi:hypothetical protein